MTYLLWLLVVAGIGLAAYAFTRRYMRVRGARLVQCPESLETVAVEVDSARAALGGEWRLTDCSRWPEKRECGRECLAQIEKSPEECLVRTVVTKWYEDKDCVVCGKPLGAIDWHERKPGVIDEHGTARPWQDVDPALLPQVLATHRPVCFDCCVAETFRQRHPDLVLDNPWMRQ